MILINLHYTETCVGTINHFFFISYFSLSLLFWFNSFAQLSEISWNINFTERGAKRSREIPCCRRESLWLSLAIKLTTLNDGLEVRTSRILPGSLPQHCKSFQLQRPWGTTIAIYDKRPRHFEKRAWILESMTVTRKKKEPFYGYKLPQSFSLFLHLSGFVKRFPVSRDRWMRYRGI